MPQEGSGGMTTTSDESSLWTMQDHNAGIDVGGGDVIVLLVVT
jgi:hypothetical protein